MNKLASRLRKFSAPSVWHVFTPLAQKTKSVNLGQGFPGFSPPTFVKDALCEAANETKTNYLTNQYARSAGHLKLVNHLADTYSEKLNRKVNGETDILITNGCSHALFLAFAGLVNPGDEIVVIEPAFDLYLAQAEMFGGVLRPVPLQFESKTNEWTLDMSLLRKAFSPKTRLFILNTPQNPTGKVMKMSELESIREIMEDFPDAVVLSDEVYEHMVYDGSQHNQIASIPGMWDKTITCSSAGKTLSATGWKVGWAVGPSHLIRPLAIGNQWNVFSVNTPGQEAVANSLQIAKEEYEGETDYFEYVRKSYQKKRQIILNGLNSAGVPAAAPEGAFFAMGDIRNIEIPEKYFVEGEYRDWAFCRFLAEEIGVAAIPPTAFYSDENKHLGEGFARFAFCQTEETLLRACERLQKLKQFQMKPQLKSSL